VQQGHDTGYEEQHPKPKYEPVSCIRELLPESIRANCDQMSDRHDEFSRAIKGFCPEKQPQNYEPENGSIGLWNFRVECRTLSFDIGPYLSVT